MFRNVLVGMACIALAVTVATPLSADSETVTVVRLTDSIEIAAPPAAVWAAMTSGKNLVTWCPYWQAESNAGIQITKVGDVLEFLDDWGNGGRSVVTFIDPNHEIRVAHEPTDGSYMCQSRFMLDENDDGTTVTYIEQYTDESSEEDMEATATAMEAMVTRSLMIIKRLAEKN